MRRSLAVAALLCAFSTALRADDLTEATLPKIRDAVLPAADEQAWREIAWLPTFWEAVVESHRAQKPILLWAMNGHPLACT